MSISSLNDKIQEKERSLSVSQALKAFDGKEYSDIIIVAVTQADSELEVCFSTDNTAKAIGLLELAKSGIVTDVWEG